MNSKNFWQVSVVEKQETDKGKIKKNTVLYLVEGPSATYAEAKVTADYDGTVFDWEITRAVKTKIVKVIGEDVTI